MNDESVKVWAKSKFDFPELKSFTICTWVKFNFEVKNNTTYNYKIWEIGGLGGGEGK